MAGQARLGGVRQGTAWQGRAGQAGHGGVGQGGAWLGLARQGMAGLAGLARQGRVRLGPVGLGEARQGRRGKARQGQVGRGLARQGRAGMAWSGMARLGLAWLGKANGLRRKDQRMDYVLPVPTSKAAYSWRYPMRVDANSVGAELEAMAEELDGKVTPGDVVAKATDERSAMHPLFEWDNAKAADKYRENQAGYILRNIRIEVKPCAKEQDRSYTIRPYINVIDQGDRFYSPVAVVMQSDEQREYALRDLRNALLAWRRKSAVYNEFAAIHAVIDAELLEATEDASTV